MIYLKLINRLINIKSIRCIRFTFGSLLVLLFLGLSSCQHEDRSEIASLPQSDSDNGGLLLPGDFEALVVVEEVPRARHLVVNENGDIYVKLRNNNAINRGGGTAALRDTDGDGKANIVAYFGDYEDEGGLACCITIHKGYLYYSSMRDVFRQKLTPGQLIPESELELIVSDTHEHGVRHWHNTKPMAFDNQGNMYVAFGSPSDACQDIDKFGPVGIPGGEGLDPCPELEKHAGIWRFDEDIQGQTQEDGYKFATGIRSVLGLTWNAEDDSLYAVVHGIDNFHTMFPDRYTSWEGAVLPAEKLIRISEGNNFGWPYGYYDQIQKKMVLQPGYGGDGKIVGRASEFDEPLMGFPGHWAPQDLLFYKGDQFPERYNEGVFIAFHGSTDRSPYPQAGYNVAFVPFEDGNPTGQWEVFADGFAQVDTVVNTSDAMYRPMGLAEGPDGSLYVSDSRQGRIWRIMYKGDKDSFGESYLAQMEERKTQPYLRTPKQIEDNLQLGNNLQGGILYDSYCTSCHQSDGMGDGSRYPPLVGSHWETSDNHERFIRAILGGLQGEVVVNGETYDDLMPAFNNVLDDLAVSSILTYIKTRLNEGTLVVNQSEVSKVRDSIKNEN